MNFPRQEQSRCESAENEINDEHVLIAGTRPHIIKGGSLNPPKFPLVEFPTEYKMSSRFLPDGKRDEKISYFNDHESNKRVFFASSSSHGPVKNLPISFVCVVKVRVDGGMSSMVV